MFFRGKNIDPIRLWGEYCEVKEASDTFLPLTFCPNPSHPNSKSPAFQINVSRPTVHCFAYCGISGSYEHAICLIEGFYDKHKVDLNLSEENASKERLLQNELRKKKAYREARKLIFRRAGVSADVSGKNNKIKLSVKTPREGITRTDPGIDLGDYSYLPKEALKYLSERGVNEASRARWQIGFDEEAKRITIPVWDHRDRLRFLIKRGIYSWQRPSYLYPDESAKSSLLFGACNLDLAMVGSIGLILVEGPLDCIRLHQYGYRNTVSILGASISRKQKELIAQFRPKRIYCFFDSDVAGVRATQSAFVKLKMFPIRVCVYPKGKGKSDPAELSKNEVEKSIARAISKLEFNKRIKRSSSRIGIGVGGGVS